MIVDMFFLTSIFLIGAIFGVIICIFIFDKIYENNLKKLEDEIMKKIEENK